MAFVKWSSELSVGVASLDAQHQILFQMFDDLDEAMLGAKDREVIGEIINGLISYAQEHFTREEKLFTQTDYRDAAAHKLEHDAFIREVEGFKQEHVDGKAGVPLRALNFMSAWLQEHICGTDKKYTAHLNSRGIK
jgi:hemerythrin